MPRPKGPELIERLENAASAALREAYESGKVAHLPGIYMKAIEAGGELAVALIAIKRYIEQLERKR